MGGGGLNVAVGQWCHTLMDELLSDMCQLFFVVVCFVFSMHGFVRVCDGKPHSISVVNEKQGRKRHEAGKK